MKKTINLKLFLFCFLFFGIVACNEDYIEPFYDDELEETDPIIPPGDKYNKEGEACLNVVYFIPNNFDSVPDWHRRLSEVTKHTQSYFELNFERFSFEETSFNLVVNEKNPDFVDITYIEADFALEDDPNIPERNKTRHIVDAIKKHFKENPERMTSNYTLVYLPNASIEGFGGSKNNGVYARFDDDDSKIDDMGFALMAVDRIDFDMNYWGSNIGHGFLKDIGAVIHELGHAFWLQHNETTDSDYIVNKDSTESTSAISMMGAYGSVNYTEKYKSVAFTESDIYWMNELDVFKATKSEDKFNIAPPEVRMRGAIASFNNETDTLKFSYNFTSSLKPIGMIFYNDPWTTDTEANDRDSYTYTERDAITWFLPAAYIKKEGEIYRASLEMDWNDFTGKGNEFVTKGEIRIRILFEGGVSYPVVMYEGSIKGNDTVRFPYKVEQGEPIFYEFE